MSRTSTAMQEKKKLWPCRLPTRPSRVPRLQLLPCRLPTGPAIKKSSSSQIQVVALSPSNPTGPATKRSFQIGVAALWLGNAGKKRKKSSSLWFKPLAQALAQVLAQAGFLWALLPLFTRSYFVVGQVFCLTLTLNHLVFEQEDCVFIKQPSGLSHAHFQELSGDVGSCLAPQIGRFDVENLDSKNPKI